MTDTFTAIRNALNVTHGCALISNSYNKTNKCTNIKIISVTQCVITPTFFYLSWSRVISGFCHEADENCTLPGCYAVKRCNSLPMFWTTYQFHLQGWLPQYKLDILLIWPIVKTHKTTPSASHGPVPHCYKRILCYLQILYGHIWMHLIIYPCFYIHILT